MRNLWKHTLAAAAALAAIAAAASAHAAGSVRLEWMKGGFVYSAETITSSGASVASTAAPDLGGSAGQVRISPIAGAVVMTCCTAAPTATQTNGMRLQTGQIPLVLPIGTGQKLAIIEAADAPAATPVSGISGGAVGDASAANQVTELARIGEVQASPTANTVLDRLKTIAANTAAISVPAGSSTSTTNITYVGGKNGNGEVTPLVVDVSGNLFTVALGNVFYTGTTTPLAGAATYTGASRDAGVAAGALHAYAYFNGFFLADQAGTASLECSNDNAAWVSCASAALVASTPLTLSVPVMFRYHRTKLLNGATLQGSVMVNSSYTGG